MRLRKTELRKTGYVFGILMAFILLAVVMMRNSSATTVGTVPVEETEMYSQVAETLQLVNEYRAQYGLDPLQVDSKLTELAMIRAFEVFARAGHYRPNGDTVYELRDEAGYNSTMRVKEVTASSSPFSGGTPAYAGFTIFKNSSDHAAILRASDSSYIGIGIAKDDHGFYTWNYIITNKPMSGQEPTITTDRKVVKEIEVNSEYAKLRVLIPAEVSYGRTKALEIGLGANATGTGCWGTVPLSRVSVTSSDSSVVRINPSDGTYSTVGVGTATVTAVLPNGISGSKLITVTSEDINSEVIFVSIDGKSTEDANGYILSGYNFQYTYAGKEVKPSIVVKNTQTGETLAEGIDYTVFYSCTTNTGTTSVDSTITVTGIGKYSGTTKRSYQINPASSSNSGSTGTTSVKVTSIKIMGNSSTYVGSTVPVYASVSPSNASNKKVTWSSGNTSIATVSSSGQVTGIAPGKTTITATATDGSGAKASWAFETISDGEDEDYSSPQNPGSSDQENTDNTGNTGSNNNGNSNNQTQGPSNTEPSSPQTTPSVTPTPTPVPALKLDTPSVSAKVDNNEIVVKWTSSGSNVDGYNIYRRNGNSGWNRIAVLDGEERSYTDNTVKAGVQYYYTVRGFKNGTMSAYDKTGASACIINLKIPSVSVSNRTNGVLVKWTSSASYVDGYYVYRRYGNKKWARIAIIKGNTLSYTDKTAKNGVLYYYTVRGYKGKTVGSYQKVGSPVYRLTTNSIASLVNMKTRRMYVRWNTNTKATGYQIQYSTSSKFTNATTKTVKGKNTFTFSKMTKGKTYYVRIRCYYAKGSVKSYGTWSSVKAVKIKK